MGHTFHTIVEIAIKVKHIRTSARKFSPNQKPLSYEIHVWMLAWNSQQSISQKPKCVSSSKNEILQLLKCEEISKIGSNF